MIEQILLLPAPHSKPQNNLINAWDLRYWTQDPKFDKTDPLQTSVTEGEWARRVAKNPQLPKWEALPLTFPQLRIVVGACGTKFGKTYGCTIRLVKEAWENPTMAERNWWVAPTYAQAENAYFAVISLLPVDDHGNKSYREQYAKLRIILLNPDGTDRSMIEFKSGDDPASLRGFAVRFFVMDEAAQGMPEASFDSVMTTTTQTKGRGIIISTPNGQGWFADVYERGVKYWEDGTPKYDENNPDPFPEWFSVRMPTHANPHVDLEEVFFKKTILSDQKFRQEYLAFFVSDANNVFKKKHIEALKRGTLQEPLPGHYYVMGLDLAKHQDYTVITIIDRLHKNVVYIERFNKIDWPLQKLRVAKIARKYNNALIVMDSTGVGDGFFDDLIDAGCYVEGFKIHGNEPKRFLVEKLVVLVEGNVISIPAPSAAAKDLYYMFDELGTYMYKYTPSGTCTYTAPKDKHDDCVVSLALACLKIEKEPFKYKHRSLRGI